MRKSGIILPIFSLPSNYGIGTLGKEAYNFVDFLEKANVSFWQVLPLGPTSYGDSPYQSFSTFAGNPYFIDLDILIEDGLLSKKEVEKYDFGKDKNHIDYGILYKNRYKVLRAAFRNFNHKSNEDYLKFKEENKDWIYDYSLFMAVKDYMGGEPWHKWEHIIRNRESDGIIRYSTLLKDNIEFQMFMQFMFNIQWSRLKEYANKKGVEIIGDIPIYVAEDSADVWSNPKLFSLDKDLVPIKVSGCPPDDFSETGQLWGNPIYNWKEHKNQNYKWWIKRIEASLKLFDVIRIDHFRGFAGFWAVPYGDETAVNGKWEKGPGIELFNAVKESFPEINVIAEDLGYITEDVRELLDYCKYPGMKVLQFAFDSKGDSEYLPHNYEKNTVVYTGTHDNNTIKGWFLSLSDEDRDFCKAYTGMIDENDNWSYIKCAISSTANIAILQMQDILNLDKEARINAPSTLGVNWIWRMNKEDMNEELAEKLKKIKMVYRRK